MCPLEANNSNQGLGTRSLAIQLFVKSLCDLHGVAFRPYLCQQFTVAYDLYLEMRCQMDKRVMRALGRDSSWHLKHACMACTYKLTGEDALIFDMLVTMDGNDSLKQLTTVDRAKYPLAIMEELLDTFRMKLGVGYDVGCHFGTTVANSELGDRAREKGLKCLVGSFHSHKHNRLCQLQFLATYVEGMGLEDLEGPSVF
ncbi:hypothetical protein B0H14DRAFT_3090510 [Mycena olivaceomarginata]|nr:hypothetical protein B0H14DRAFT_3090510 [Mycena olivaceomarginata]